jgi:hypothetical protein
MKVIGIIMSFNFLGHLSETEKKSGARGRGRRADSKNLAGLLKYRQDQPLLSVQCEERTITLIVITFLLLLGMHQNFMHFYLNIRVLAASSVMTLLSTVCSSF